MHTIKCVQRQHAQLQLRAPCSCRFKASQWAQLVLQRHSLCSTVLQSSSRVAAPVLHRSHCFTVDQDKSLHTEFLHCFSCQVCLIFTSLPCVYSVCLFLLSCHLPGSYESPFLLSLAPLLSR